jgi:hypothetical protein
MLYFSAAGCRITRNIFPSAVAGLRSFPGKLLNAGESSDSRLENRTLALLFPGVHSDKEELK